MKRRVFLRRALYIGTGMIGATTFGVRNAFVTPVMAAPNPPALVDAQGRSDTTIQLLWMAVSGADSYTIYRNSVALTSQPGTLYNDTGLSGSTSYSYEITATAGGAESVRSASVVAATQAPRDTQAPTQPGSITVSNVASSSAKLSWARSSDNVDIVGYRILRGAVGTPVADLIQISTTDAINSYSPTNLKANTAYQFAVIALDPANNLSSPSSVTFTTGISTDTTAPAAPSSSSLVATPFSASRIDLIWGASSSTDVSGYQVFRDGALLGEVYLPMRRYFSDNGLAALSTHSYQLRAIDSAGNLSALTTGRTATTLASGSVKIVRGPYLQRTMANSTLVVWWTNIPAPSQVKYGIGSLTSEVNDPVATLQHAMLIGALTAGTTYSYQVLSGSAASATINFRTAATAGSTFSFAAVGDFGGGSTDETIIANNIASGGTQFVLTLGDNVYPDAQDPDFTTTYFDIDHRLYKPYSAVMRQQTMWFANGNKEYYGDGALWRNVMTPNNNSWYSFDWGDAHILVLDTEQPFTPGTPQYQFAQSDLSANQSKLWRIVVIHRPPYSSTSDNSSSSAVRADLVPLLEQQQVHLVLSGNSHNYERTYPLLGGVQSAEGVTYIVSGGGGNGLNNFTIAAPAWSAFREATFEHLKITVSPTALKVDAIKSDTNAVFDTVTIASATPPTVGTITGVVTDAGTGTALAGATVSYSGGSVATNASGTYTLSNVTPGTYTVTATAIDYDNQMADVTVVSGGTAQHDFALAAQIARIFADDFETGNLSLWNSSAGLVIQTATVHGGSRAAQGNTINGNTYAKKTLPGASGYTNAYARIYFNILSASSQVNLLRIRSTSDTSIAYLFVSTSGMLGLRSDNAAMTTTSTTTVGAGWHALELRAVINGTASATEVWLDGVKITTLSITTNLGTTAIGRLQIGDTMASRTYNVVYDDVVFDTQPIGL
jgi:hypothetical protein